MYLYMLCTCILSYLMFPSTDNISLLLDECFPKATRNQYKCGFVVECLTAKIKVENCFIVR